jgi:YgiT-type zinc finger domain-containing protein
MNTQPCLSCDDGRLVQIECDVEYPYEELEITIGTTAWQCPDCGEVEVDVPKMTQLHEVITAVGESPARFVFDGTWRRQERPPLIGVNEKTKEAARWAMEHCSETLRRLAK